MRIGDFLDSTYLKTPKQSGLSNSETLERVHELVREANAQGFFAVMVRPDYVRSVRMLLDSMNSPVRLGTVIDFPEGTNSVAEKISEAQGAIANGADELDFVIDFNAYKAGNYEKVREEVELCSRLCLNEGKIVKWIIETAALTDDEIVGITKLIRQVAEDKLNNFPLENIFVKTSTGFFKTPDGSPNGATPHVAKLIVENKGPLSAKASGGVRSAKDAKEMIDLGISRIGTSSALDIVSGKGANEAY